MNPLRSCWQLLRKYPYSVCMYIIYIAILGRLKYVNIRLRYQTNIPHAWKLMNGEGIMYGYLFLTIWGVIFALVTMACIIAYNAHQRYYTWLLILIIIPLFFMWQY
jgi:hypothetical protein